HLIVVAADRDCVDLVPGWALPPVLRPDHQLVTEAVADPDVEGPVVDAARALRPVTGEVGGLDRGEGTVAVVAVHVQVGVDPVVLMVRDVDGGVPVVVVAGGGHVAAAVAVVPVVVVDQVLTAVRLEERPRLALTDGDPGRDGAAASG